MSVSTKITIQNLKGLHARATSKFVKTAEGFQSDVKVTKGEEGPASGKSIMGLLMLGASLGEEITITADGSDENEAIKALTDLINDRFGEDM